MNKIKTGTGPAALHATFKILSVSYSTRFSSVNYSKPKTRLRKSRFRISLRGPAIRNNFVANAKKELESSSLFKSKVKSKLPTSSPEHLFAGDEVAKLLDFENEITFF